jgi:hypothetical protein
MDGSECRYGVKPGQAAAGLDEQVVPRPGKAAGIRAGSITFTLS